MPEEYEISEVKSCDLIPCSNSTCTAACLSVAPTQHQQLSPATTTQKQGGEVLDYASFSWKELKDAEWKISKCMIILY